VELGEGFSEGLHQSLIDSKIKAAFTRRCNGEVILAKASRPGDKNFKPTKLSRAEVGAANEEETRNGEEEEDEEEKGEEESVDKDRSIKVLGGKGGGRGGAKKGGAKDGAAAKPAKPRAPKNPTAKAASKAPKKEPKKPAAKR